MSHYASNRVIQGINAFHVTIIVIGNGEMLIVFGSMGLGVLVVVSTVLGIVRAYGYRMEYCDFA